METTVRQRGWRPLAGNEHAHFGYIVRVTRKWPDQGYPLCSHGQPMHEE